MKFLLKTAAVKTLRTLLKGGHLLPVNHKKVLFSAYEGELYGCNPKYIFERLYEKNPELDFVWVLNDPGKLPEKYRHKVRTVKFLSPAHIRELLSSGVIVSNLGIEPFLPKRDSQTFINTWHGGGAYKRVTWDMDIFPPEQKRYMAAIRGLRSESTDVFLSSCRRFTEVSSRDFEIDERKFVSTGIPRNDLLIESDSGKREEIRHKLSREHGLDTGSLFVLYAPTFRGTFREQADIDMQVCCRDVKEALSSRFGKDVNFLFRSHVSKDENGVGSLDGDLKITNLTSYPDMQELLLAADVLITDYSSSIWDFCLTGKPAFLFMPDLKFYLKNYGFYTPLEDWPYPYAENVEDFCRLIRNYSETDNRERISRHLSLLGSYEHGKGGEQAIEIIENSLGS